MAGGLDFGFLKEEMMAEIDAPCDHATILWERDPLLPILAPDFLPSSDKHQLVFHEHGDGPAGRLYIVPFVPTAENLARHWFERLAPKVLQRSENRATLVRIRVYETPNCWADYCEPNDAGEASNEPDNGR